MKKENIENIYRLSPIQQGMLFHTLYAPGEGVYFEQFNMTFGAGFEPSLFERTWRDLVARNPILRTSFIWESLEEPVQVVNRQVELPFEVLDWRGLPEAESGAKLQERLAEERRRGFDLLQAPLMRFCVIRLRDDLYHVIWSYHHLILDGWSVGLLLQDAHALYRAVVTGGSFQPQPRRPFRDYIAWLRQLDLSAIEGYWRRVLGGFTTPTPLGVDRPAGRGRPEESGRAMASALVPEGESEALKAWARENRLTLSTVLQGAWSLVLSRYSGEDDLVFGVTVSGRPTSLPGVDTMLGCFINTLPVRVRVPGGAPVRAWLQSMQAEQLEMRRYEQSPLVQVLGWSDVPRPTPLFESIFVFEGFTDTAREGAFQRTGYPLTLVAGPDREIVLRIDYELERFEPAVIERLLGHMRSVLPAFLANPEQRLDAIDILTPGELRQVREWSATAVRYDGADLLLHEIIAARVASQPDAVAVVFGQESLTYGELDARAGRLARRLRRMGVGPEVLVGVCAERSLEMVVALLAVLKAGGGYVPLDPSYPADRLAYMLEDSRVPVLLAQTAVLDRLPAPEARVVLLDGKGAGEEDGAPEEQEPAAAVTPGNVAYMIYTSGSTGRPKGAMNTHRAIVNRLLWMQDALGLDATDRVLQKTPFSFDVSVWEFFWPLMMGACLVVAKPGGHQDPDYLVEEIARQRVTTLHFVPSMLQVFLEARGLERCAALRRVVCSGEALPAELQRRFHEIFAAPLINLYGPTEAAVDVSCWWCARGDDRTTVPIGRPVANTELHVLDRAGRRLPIGVGGELFIGGIQVGRGYHRRPELTAEKFVPDPFGSVAGGRAGARLYRTGDLARHLPDGAIEFLGRIDHQVKIRGLRIELGEIEAALTAHPSVREAVVVATADQRLVGYVVAAAGVEVSPAELRAHLATTLPEYMVPAVFVPLEALPLSPNGKVDRRALPAPGTAASSGAEAFASPRTPLEELIAGVWSEVLKVGKVGRDDNFFELGGHSLLATRVLSRLRETLDIDVPLRALFEATTVARQAALMEEMRLTAGKLAMPPLRRVSRKGEIPLSFGQERFWFIDRLQPGSAAYNIPGRVRIAGRLDTPALLRAFAEVVRRHEALRTVFPLRKGQASQVIRSGIGTLPLVDLRGLPDAARERERRTLVQLVSQLPFDLAKGPLYRFMLLRLEDETHVLLLTVHHIVSDGWSMGILVREIGALYEAFSAGRPSPLPELPFQYADFAAWQREWLQGEVLEAQIDFWRQRLAGAPPVTNFPLDHPRPALQTYRGDRRALLLTPELTDGLKALGRRQGVTLFMVLLALLDTLLVRHGGQEDLVVGSPIAGRGKVEIEGLVGLFLNMLLLRTDASGNPSFAALLLRVRESALSAYAHQDLPFEKLVDELAPERNLSQTAFFQILLVLQNAPLEPLVLPGITLSPVTSDAEASKLDFTLDAVEMSGKLVIALRFNPDLFEATTIERLAGHLQRLLETVVIHPERPIHEISLLSEGELQQLREWSATAVHYPGDLLLHRLIEAQVDRDPEAVAVVAGEASLTYRELDRRANGLARRLRERGVGPEVPVGVCAERSLEMVVALVAVLKAGGGYVPLDPSYPADRLAFMLASAGTPVLLVQPALLERLPEHGSEVLLLVAGEEDAEDLRPAVEIDPDGLAYAIFTSGSTGRPKGAMNSHRGIVNRLLWMQETFGLDATDRVLQKTPFSFDVSVWEFFWPLMTGARLVMAKPGGHQDPAYLVEEIVAQEITTLHFVPSMLQVFLEARGVGRCGSLRRVLCSGEALPAELARRFYELLDAPLHNLYGPTEAAVDVSWWPCERGSSRAAVPIGRPVANTGLRILGREGELMPVGVAGELWIGGVQVGRGYLGRPELTAERFVPDPFGLPGARAYRTGDLTRFLPDGAIEFLGRIDFQVKIRGFRIELGEIEAALTGQGAVRETVVVADRSAGTAGAVGDWRLIAYVVAAAGAEVTVADLRSHLGAVLPDYMIPAVFVLLDALPLNPNGKVDRKALPAPDFEATGAAAEYVAPRTVLETGLARLWSEVLGVEVERIGLRDHFFDLGGNSITGAIFINQLQEMLGEIIHVVALFDAPVLERFAAFVAREYPAGVARIWGEEVAEAGAAAPAAEPTVDEERLAQIRWHLRKLAPAILDGIVNPPALFVLSPPRSGSTLLRVMLGGNPQLFAPPELELLNFNTLRERREAFPGRDSFRLEGLLRAVVEVQGITPEEAGTLVEQLEWNGTTTQEAYRILQERIAPRLLVDKTPTYAWDPATLRRAEEVFGGARYLHLVRHPYGMIHSFEEARIDQIFFAENHSFDRRELAEALWGIAHQNILDFLAEVPPERQQTLHFEELLKDPEGVLRGVCASLGIDYHPDMAVPYVKRRARMTDGLYAESRMLGDVKFHEHSGVDAEVAERWREAYDHDFLGEATWRLAARLGYDVERERVGVIAGLEGEAAVLEAGDWREGEALPLSFSQERLWFLDQLDPGTRTYNVSMSVRLLGRLDVPVLGRSLEEIARRHAALRTTFAAAQGNPVQIIGPEPRLEPRVVDLSALPAAAGDLAARDAVAAYGGEPFDLAAGPLIRALLVRLGAEDHVASFTAHHIVCDGWSIGVLVREVAALYAAFVAGEPSPLPALPVQYVDFARWQRRWLEGAAIERQLAYWRERLAGVPVLQLPGDRPRPSVQSFRGSTHGFVLSGELSAALRMLSRERGATSFMTVMAAFQAFLGRYSGQEDFAVGSPVAGRNRKELEPLIGFFVNTLVLRADLAGAPGFATLLERVRRASLEGYAHQDVPFEKVVQEIAPERNLSYPPLFQVMLAFQNAPAARFELPGLTLAPVAEDFAVSKFDLSLTVFDNGPQIFGQWVYSTALFEAETIARWAGHFQTLLAELTADPARRLTELPLLTAPEREQLLVEWNRPPADYPDEGFVHRLVEEQAARTPQAAAVVFEAESLSYGELNARANRLARHLRDLGVGPESVVGISAERSFEMVVGLLAILKAGGAYLPLDPALPAERLAFMMEDAGIGLLLAQERLVPDLPARDGLRIVPLDSLDGPAVGSERDLGVPVLPDHPAYVIYTSGSTGQPKGVVVSHRALGNRLQYARTGDVTAADAFLQKTTISFDVSLLEIFAPLAAGGRTVLARPGGQQDAAYLVDLIREQGITYASFPPALLSVLFEQPGFDGCASLRTVITGGETVPAPLPGQFYAVLPGADLLNRYGPTEATISVTSWLCERGAPPRTLPIGRPTAKARVYLLDRELQPVPVGMPGEIFLGGLCVARGYLRQPALTAEKFVPDPFSGDAGGRLYRTGDLARYRTDGAIEFAGRVDQQVKIRGFRVELGEIEAVLARHPAVREVAVVDREDGPTRSLAAYLVFQPGEAPEEGELRRFLLAALPAYMVPADFVVMAALPLAPTGKVDRRALPAPERRSAAAGFAAPRNPAEERLAAIWAALLSRETVGIHDSFFDLGGHSLLATQVISRVRESFGVELPLRLLFERPTVAALAEAVEAALGAGSGLTAPPLVPVPRGGDLPLSFAQQRLWFLEQLQPGTATYNMPTAVRFRGVLDVAALRGSLREVVRRHEALRTTFAVRGGTPVQVVAEPALEMPLIDLRRLPEEEREAAVRRLAGVEARRPFDLGAGPLIRATLLRSGEDEHVALLTTHHIVSDGWSMGVLIGELAALYPALLAGEPSPLPELAVQYGDFAVWQRQWLRGEVLESQLAYWRRVLAGHAVLQLPTDRPRPAVQQFRGADEPLAFGREASRAFLDLGRRQGATSYMTLLAGFQALLYRYSGQDDVIVGATVAGRDRRELEPLIGFFVNTLPMRTGLSGRPAFRELLDRVREVALGALSHQDLPFEKLVEELQPERDLSRSPLFQVVFQFQQAAAAAALELPGLTLSPVEGSSQSAKFDIVLNLREGAGGLLGVWKFNTDLFDRATLARMSRHFEMLIAGAAADPDRSLAELPILTAAERRQLGLEERRSEALGGSCLHEIFAAQAARAPEAIAVSCEGEGLSYGELDQRANRLAHHLIASGVAPGDLVGLCLERSVGMVVAMLAVLKAGGAYVPLDPAYPRERLAFMLEDSQVPVLIAQESLAAVLPEPGPGTRVILLDRDRERILGESAGDPRVAVAADYPAYVIYTSGSTGQPKGVVVRHGNAVRLFTATEPWFGFGAEDVWTLFHSYAFDFSVWELWGALLHGGRLVVVPYWVSRSPEAFYDLLATERVTVLNQTPSAFRQLIWAEESALGGAAPDLALRYVVFGGEALEPASLAPWFERHGDQTPRLINMYGITETTVHVTYRPVGWTEVAGAGSVIGRPIPDLGLYVLDAAAQPLPAGVPGEIHVGGAGLALGYLGRPELTAERFVPDPYGEPGSRLYRSGDLARFLADGDLEYLGRIDHQVKIRGFRIELGEIESALAAHPAVREAVVLAREDGAERRLVAYVVPAGAAAPGLAELREALAATLPEYMLPSSLVALDRMPLTANGKVDRRALPAPGAAGSVLEASYVAPANDLERFLAILWQEVLKVSQVGVHDDFFAVGGSSITGAVLVSRLQEKLREIVHVVVIFDHPTIAEMSAYLIDQHPEGVARLFGRGALGSSGGRAAAVAAAGDAELAELRSLIRPLAPLAQAPARNPKAVFVLSPPRSGSTLMRVMLGGHPRLFSPPELELLSFNTLQERRAAFSGRDAFWLEGVIRAVMEIRGCGAEEAEALVAGCEREGLTALEFYGRLQEWLGDRILVDKTPSYALDPAVLRRAEEGFEEPRYIHLIRHPLGMIHSFEEAKLDQLFFRYEHPFSRRQLAELIWRESHENIVEFLGGVPAGRQHWVRFEDLLREPEAILRGICEFLGLEYHPDMAEPYKRKSARMTDGVHAESRMLGDVKFHQYQGVEARVAERWRESHALESLDGGTRDLAARLGYDVKPEEPGERWSPIPSVLVGLQPGGSEPPLFLVHPLSGELFLYRQVVAALGPEQPVYGLQAVGFAADEEPLTTVEEMAAVYVNALLSFQPQGPYLLAGSSLGGLIAFEMARKLRSLQREVAFLALLDAPDPARFARQQGDAEGDAELSILQHVAQGAPGVSLGDLRALAPEERLRLILDHGRRAGTLAGSFGLPELRRLVRVVHANRQAVRAYEPQPFDTSLFYIRAEEGLGDDAVWAGLALGGAEVHEAPGNHLSMHFPPHAETLAARLRSCIEHALRARVAETGDEGLGRAVET
ncbi:MAG TPA: non-ribosomal peptide synthase/polyketide synthase [Thermoanaerobaculia bacterium]|nr:non-ribosomal peptide synthase/polyketide synthase [Thermoanaerobaculia bacterium]